MRLELQVDKTYAEVAESIRSALGYAPISPPDNILKYITSRSILITGIKRPVPLYLVSEREGQEKDSVDFILIGRTGKDSPSGSKYEVLGYRITSDIIHKARKALDRQE